MDCLFLLSFIKENAVLGSIWVHLGSLMSIHRIRMMETEQRGHNDQLAKTHDYYGIKNGNNQHAERVGNNFQAKTQDSANGTKLNRVGHYVQG